MTTIGVIACVLLSGLILVIGPAFSIRLLAADESKDIAVFITVTMLTIGVIFAQSVIFMILWNLVIPTVFITAPKLALWQALAMRFMILSLAKFPSMPKRREPKI